MGFKWKGQYYYERCLSFGLASAPQLFERFSCAIHWILVNKFNIPAVSHVLDDFIFFNKGGSDACLVSLNTFIHVSKTMNLPLKPSKTVTPRTTVVLHGIEVDTERMEARLPEDKLEKARQAVRDLGNRKKATVRELQSVIGYLCFVCKVVTPGRTFLRRLFDLLKGNPRSHFYVRISKGAQLDLAMWKLFLDDHRGVTILNERRWNADPKRALQTDSAQSRGFAAVLGESWVCGAWPAAWTAFHITILELYPICAAVEIWVKELTNACIVFYCDNESMCSIINTRTSRDPIAMILLRRLVLVTMEHNIMFRATHVRGLDNSLPDAISRFQFGRARRLAPWLRDESTRIPEHLLPSNILQQN